MVFKLYRFEDSQKEYWETWDNDDGTHTVHWGVLGTKGESKDIKGTFLKRPEKIIQSEINEMVSKGYMPVNDEYRLIIEYSVEGMGTKEDVEKRHRLETRMNETLGWTGLGHCDGGSIGSRAMEVCNLVVDFECARKIIQNDLKGTEFENYTRIYDEEAE